MREGEEGGGEPRQRGDGRDVDSGKRKEKREV